jgi:hypothetical protein
MMNEPTWAPPAPPKKRRRWPWIAAVAAVGIGIGAAVGGNTSTAPAPASPTTPQLVERTDAPSTTAAVDDLDAWLDEHAEQVSTFADENYSILTVISSTAGSGDFVATRLACLDGLTYLTGIRSNDFVTEGPDIFGDAIDAYITAYTACSEGDFETATVWTERGTALIGDLTDLMD